MFDDDNDNDDALQPEQPRAPKLPADLAAKLFDLSDPASPAVRYPGPELWPHRVVWGTPQGFTTWVNPSTRRVRMRFNLGPDKDLGIGFEMNLIPPPYRLARGVVMALVAEGRLLRREYNALVVEIPPNGTVTLPAEFDRAVRTMKDGMVTAGACPWLLKEGEEPPPIHPALLPAEDTVSFASAPGVARRLT